MTGTQNNATGQLGHPQPCSSGNRSRIPGGSNPVCSDGIPTETKKTMTGKPNSEQTVRAQLNEIAEHWVTHEEYPEETSVTDVQQLSHTLHEELADRIETYVEETTFSRREAEIWALQRHVNEHHQFVTHEAAALLYSTPGTGFGELADAEKTHPERQIITTDDVEVRLKAAERKVEDAEQTLGAVTFPERNDVLRSPKPVWLDRETTQRLRQQHESGEHTLNDVATRLLDEVETRRSLEEIVHGYLNARGKENVAQVAIERQSLETGTLHITAHTGIEEKLPDIVTETDAITLRGRRYALHFVEDPYGPQDMGRITLYASDSITRMDAVTLEDGLATADEYMQALLNSDKPLPARTIE